MVSLRGARAVGEGRHGGSLGRDGGGGEGRGEGDHVHGGGGDDVLPVWNSVEREEGRERGREGEIGRGRERGTKQKRASTK